MDMKSNRSKRWMVAAVITAEAKEALAGFPPILQQVLFNRGHATAEDARAYLNAEVVFDPSPFAMTGMTAGVERIRFALSHAEPIAIYGDYDVDGVSATALLVQALRAQGGNIHDHIPNRFDEGYGLNNEALATLKENGYRLVITVDCGIRSLQEAAYARKIGLDLIITDHHQPAEGELPDALAVIDPKQAGDAYPDKDLAGVGVAYKLIQALMELNQGKVDDFQPEHVLDLVALGTVADLAPFNRRKPDAGTQRSENAA